MENQEEVRRKLVEHLWAEINKAILDSSRVKIALMNIKGLGLLNEVSEYSLVLDVNKLIDMMAMGREGPAGPVPRENVQGAPPEKRQCIDGKPMTPNQVRFEEYARARFDEREWMKKAGIRF
ncbi:MAG: hypothetical protein HY579_12770 [Nitrospinae bacterium]|nr:hypothetical protein [Nitrospinota bacterium]